MAHLSPSAIFSPSVARQQLAAAKDWNYVDGWLASKFNGKPAPPFERNNDTLKAFLALAALNENADEDHDLLSKVETQSLDELRSRATSDPNVALLNSLEANLTREGKTGLDALSTAGVVLNLPFAGTEQLAEKVLDLQLTSFNLDQVADRVAILERELNTEFQLVNFLLNELQSDAYQPPADLSKETLDYQRKTKVLAAKLPELKDRVSAISAAIGTPKPTIQEVHVEEGRFKELMGVVKSLETQVRGYHGLPHDTDLARLELEALRVELKDITRKRDGMFEGLVERESPQKFRSQ